MAKLLKLRRGSTTAHASFTGAEGEVTIDTTKDTAVVHDGAQAGGRPLAREDMNNVSSNSIVGRIGTSALAGVKVQPNFGSQNVETTGTLASGDHTVTGNISVSGTVDGRDVASDGSKLDGVESGATGDQTAAEIRTLVESASDSNVFTDADHSKLNNIESGATADQSASEILTAIKTVDGVNSGLNADLLDNMHASDTASNGTIVARNASGYVFANYFNTTPNDVTSNVSKVCVETGNDGYIRHGSAQAIRSFINVENGATADQTKSDIDALNINADTVDGVHGSSFLRSDASDTFTGTLTMGTQQALVANNYGRGVFGVYSSTRYQHVWSMGTAYKTSDDGSSYGNMYGLTYTHTNIGTGTNQAISGLSHQLQHRTNGTLTAAIGTGIWTSGNVTAYSDIAVKRNLVRIPDALNKVSLLNGYTFERTDHVQDPEDPESPEILRQAGVVAQEVEKVLPEVVSGQEGNKAVAYGNMVALLIEAIKELKAEVEELKGGK